jgi:hypothetical protein
MVNEARLAPGEAWTFDWVSGSICRAQGWCRKGGAVPEPAALPLFATGLFALMGWLAWRKKACLIAQDDRAPASYSAAISLGRERTFVSFQRASAQ